MFLLDYEFYTKNGLPYPSDSVSTIIISFIACYFPLLPLAYFWSHKVNIVIIITLSIMVSFGFVFLEEFGKAFGNPNQSEKTNDYAGLILVTGLIITGALYFYAGAYLTIATLKFKTLPGSYLIAWLSLSISIPTVIYLKDVYEYRNKLNNFVELHIDWKSAPYFPTILLELKFENLKNKSSTSVNFEKNLPNLSEDTRSDLNIIRSDARAKIPYNANQIYVKYYSPLEQRIYEDSGEFNFKRLPITRFILNKQRQSSPMSLFVRPSGIIDVFISDPYPYLAISYSKINFNKLSKIQNNYMIKNLEKFELDEIQRIANKFEKEIAKYSAPELVSLSYQIVNNTSVIESYVMEVEDVLGLNNEGRYSFFSKTKKMFLPRKIIITDNSQINKKAYRIVFEELEQKKLVDDFLATIDEDEKNILIIINIESKIVQLSINEHTINLEPILFEVII